MLIIAWQYALLMQIPDALAWRDLKAKYPGKLAFLLNTTQPIVAVVAVAVMLIKLNVSLVRLIPAIVLVIVYAGCVIKKVASVDFDISPSTPCTNLDYSWWGEISPVMYYIVMLAAFAAIPSLPNMVLTSGIFLGTVLVSGLLVGKKCNSGSLWCWAVASAGLVTGTVALGLNKHGAL